MQCPSCSGTSLTPTDDGRQVCDDCGEELVGFQEEEVDFNLIGTAVSNRQSQSFQAQSVREKIDTRQKTATRGAIAALNKIADQVLICEGVFILAKAITTRLIQLRYVHQTIRTPLFQIITSWVRHRHDGSYNISSLKTFQPVHVLSMICLASIYVRSPMLPRDICRLVYTKQIPFETALRTVFPQSFSKSKLIRRVFTPNRLPLARQVIRAAIFMIEDDYCWLPLKTFFLKNNVPKPSMFHSREPKLAFPLGHIHLTLLRLSRLLGLPDQFGERVLRLIELRQIAVKMSRVFGQTTDGPWDNSAIDTCEAKHIPSMFQTNKPFSKVVTNASDLYAHPTDESLQVDFINTMRICYGQERNNNTNIVNPLCKETMPNLSREWEQSQKSMYMWLLRGNVEDFNSVSWTSLSPNVLSELQGHQLHEYTNSLDLMLSERGEGLPDLWGPLARTFEEIGMSSSKDTRSAGNQGEKVDPGKRMRSYCMYEYGHTSDRNLFSISENLSNMNTAYPEAAQRLDSNTNLSVRPWELRNPCGLVQLKSIEENIEQSSADVETNSNIEQDSRFDQPMYSDRQNSEDMEQISQMIVFTQNVLHTDNIHVEPVANFETNEAVDREKSQLERVPTEKSKPPVRKSPSPKSNFDIPDPNSKESGSMEAIERVSDDTTETFVGMNRGNSNAKNIHKKDSSGSSKRDSAECHSQKDQEKSTERHLDTSRKRQRDTDVQMTPEKLSSVSKEEGKLRKKRRRNPIENDFLVEPAGIGLAWTIISRFFNGSNIEVEGMELGVSDKFPIHRLRAACDTTLGIVIRYILGLQKSVASSQVKEE